MCRPLGAKSQPAYCGYTGFPSFVLADITVTGWAGAEVGRGSQPGHQFSAHVAAAPPEVDSTGRKMRSFSEGAQLVPVSRG